MKSLLITLTCMFAITLSPLAASATTVMGGASESACSIDLSPQIQMDLAGLRSQNSLITRVQTYARSGSWIGLVGGASVGVLLFPVAIATAGSFVAVTAGTGWVLGVAVGTVAGTVSRVTHRQPSLDQVPLEMARRHLIEVMDPTTESSKAETASLLAKAPSLDFAAAQANVQNAALDTLRTPRCGIGADQAMTSVALVNQFFVNLNRHLAN